VEVEEPARTRKPSMSRSKSAGRMGGLAKKGVTINTLPSKFNELKKTEFAPHYQIEEVKHFLECFRYVDRNMSGEIDIDEWQEFLKGMNQEMSGTDSRRLFMHIDENHNGAISMGEICKVVFNRASAMQQKIMVNVMNCELSAQIDDDNHKAMTDITRDDLRQLYKIYDEESKMRMSVKDIALCVQMLKIDEMLIFSLFADAGVDNIMKPEVDEELFVDVIYSYLKGTKNSRLH